MFPILDEMTEAEIDTLLVSLDLYGLEDGGAKERACFQAARAIRGLRAEIGRMFQQAQDDAFERDLSD